MIEYEVAAKTDDFVIVHLRGELLGDLPVQRIHEALEDPYVDDGVRVIKVDLSEVSRVSLEGVAVLVDLWRESNRRHKRFLAENASAPVREKFATTGVLRLLTGEE